MPSSVGGLAVVYLKHVLVGFEAPLETLRGAVAALIALPTLEAARVLLSTDATEAVFPQPFVAEPAPAAAGAGQGDAKPAEGLAETVAEACVNLYQLGDALLGVRCAMVAECVWVAGALNLGCRRSRHQRRRSRRGPSSSSHPVIKSLLFFIFS